MPKEHKINILNNKLEKRFSKVPREPLKGNFKVSPPGKLHLLLDT